MREGKSRDEIFDFPLVRIATGAEQRVSRCYRYTLYVARLGQAWINSWELRRHVRRYRFQWRREKPKIIDLESIVEHIRSRPMQWIVKRPMLDPNLTLFSPHINIKHLNLFFQESFFLRFEQFSQVYFLSLSLGRRRTAHAFALPIHFFHIFSIFNLNNCLITLWIIHNSCVCYWQRRRKRRNMSRTQYPGGRDGNNKRPELIREHFV